MEVIPTAFPIAYLELNNNASASTANPLKLMSYS